MRAIQHRAGVRLERNRGAAWTARVYYNLTNGTTQPVVSTLNAEDGTVTSNLAIAPTKNGSVDVFGSDPTNLILDISGYFAP